MDWAHFRKAFQICSLMISILSFVFFVNLGTQKWLFNTRSSYFNNKFHFSAKEIVDAIQKCDRMTALCLEGNTLGVEAAEAIAKALRQHSEFQVNAWKLTQWFCIDLIDLLSLTEYIFYFISNFQYFHLQKQTYPNIL